MDIAKYVLQFIAGLGALLVGLKIFSETIEKLLGKQLSKLFDKTAKNKFAGVGVGVATSALLHSSSATTVMVVGLTNIGILPLAAAATIIIGANIGTTVTAQIAAIGTIGGGNTLSISVICMAFTFVGILMNMVVKSDKLKVIGYSIAGFGLIFFGLHIMSSSVTGLLSGSAGDSIKNAFQLVTNPILLLFIGIAITSIVQSSTAVTTILISMVAANLTIGNGGDCILYIILGTNIGTCATALFSSIGTNTNAKRASLIHLIFNICGSVLFVIMLLIWDAVSATSFMDMTFGKWFKDTPALQISMFHTFFNVVTALIFIPLSDLLVKLVERIIPDKKNKTNTHVMKYTDIRLVKTNPSLALNQLRKETMALAEECIATLEIALDDFFNKTSINEKKIRSSIDDSNEYANEILEYLIKLTATGELSQFDASDASRLHHVLTDVIRISEVSDNVIKYSNKFQNENLEFSKGVNEELKEMFNKVKEMFVVSKETFIEKNFDLLSQVDSIEDEVDNMRSKIINEHIERLNAGVCHFENIGIFVNIVSNIERVGDHINYIAHTIENY